MTTHTLFVYGTLQTGQHNHRVLRDAAARFVGVATTKAEFTLRAAYPGGGYPYLCPGGETEVFGEVYEVDDAGLRRCDALEGYPRHYDRREIELAYLLPEGNGPAVPNAKALVYTPAERELARMDDARNPRIASGSWKGWIDGTLARRAAEERGEEEAELIEDEEEDEDEEDAEDADPDPDGTEAACAECGEPFFVSGEGTAHHVGEDPDGIDHDADADHVPYAGE